jgi:hypothetical protein
MSCQNRPLEAEDRPGGVRRSSLEERQVDLRQIGMNYSQVGSSASRALLLIRGQSGSWWSDGQVMDELSASFNEFAADLRGQGRSTWTPASSDRPGLQRASARMPNTRMLSIGTRAPALTPT